MSMNESVKRVELSKGYLKGTKKRGWWRDSEWRRRHRVRKKRCQWWQQCRSWGTEA